MAIEEDKVFVLF